MENFLHIFLIDDDEDDKEMFCEVLKEINPCFSCIISSGGVQALQMLENQVLMPDLIFLDLNMPRMNGKQCLMKIKKMEKYSSVPVIIYSTTKVEDEIMETKKLGAEDFMVKPNSMRQLKKELEMIFEKMGKLALK